jgi:hypothetical protein
MLTKGSSAVVVERNGWKPCCVGEVVREAVIVGRSRRLRILITGLINDMEQYDDPKPAGLPGFKTGNTRAAFQMAGTVASLTDRLKIDIRKARPASPKCFRWTDVRPSGPVAVELLAFLMASSV